jgi:uncharacterized protein
MRPSESLERHEDEVRAVVARFGASNQRLFGSAARNDDTEASDIDVMVDLAEGASYYQVFRIEDTLSDMLGCRVDVHVPGRPNSRVAKRIEADPKPL